MLFTSRGKSDESLVQQVRACVQSISNLIVDRTEARFLSLRAPGTNITCEKARKAEFEAEKNEKVVRRALKRASLLKRHPLADKGEGERARAAG